MAEIKGEHILFLVAGVCLVYYFMGKCGCKEGWLVRSDLDNPTPQYCALDESKLSPGTSEEDRMNMWANCDMINRYYAIPGYPDPSAACRGNGRINQWSSTSDQPNEILNRRAITDVTNGKYCKVLSDPNLNWRSYSRGADRLLHNNVAIPRPRPPPPPPAPPPTVHFSIAVPLPGCTDRNAQNYTPGSTQDDGSCTYPKTCTNMQGISQDSQLRPILYPCETWGKVNDSTATDECRGDVCTDQDCCKDPPLGWQPAVGDCTQSAAEDIYIVSRIYNELLEGDQFGCQVNEENNLVCSGSATDLCPLLRRPVMRCNGDPVLSEQIMGGDLWSLYTGLRC